MNRTLLTQALIKFLAGILLIGLLVFLPVGSFAYWQGWLLMGVLFIPMFFAGIVMLAKNPDLLRKRLNAKEKEGEQKAVVALSGLLFTLYRRSELEVRLVDVAGLDCMDGRCPLYFLLLIICGSIAGKRVPLQNHRSPGRTESH